MADWFANGFLLPATNRDVLGLTRSAAVDYAKQGIRLNAVNPGFICTEIVKPQSLQEMGITSEQFELIVSSSIPMGRMSQPEEIAQSVVFLCSDAASYITGQSFAINGGLVAGYSAFWADSYLRSQF